MLLHRLEFSFRLNRTCQTPICAHMEIVQALHRVVQMQSGVLISTRERPSNNTHLCLLRSKHLETPTIEL